MESKYLILCTITGFLVALDQVVKIYVHANFALGESVPVIPDIFHITYVRNTGAAFGVFRDASALFRNLFFLSMPPIAMVIILFMLKSVANTDRWQIFSLSLIFGGALGNYIDRLRFGYVIDFLDFHYKDVWSYPAFNVADSAIVSGVCLLLVMMTVRERRAKRASAEQKA
ncbi:MAG: signal peptidase II [Bdellovibrionales bacterium]